MHHQFRALVLLITLAGAALADSVRATDHRGDLSPLPAREWSKDNARHLLERAGFGGTAVEVDALYSLGLAGAVEYLVSSEHTAEQTPFDHSGIFEPGLDPFPPSRPATTRLAQENGEALGVAVKAGGNRPVQPVVNQFFYWLRASRLETDRVSYWWAQRMLTSPAPLQEKMALFWHGHFATNEDKVRDYRKMLQQVQLFQRQGLGNFRDLLIAVAQDPAMLAFLDAGVNVKDAPNENFAREIMELFTMGVGHYTEQDVREAARAFTGWNYEGLAFAINEELHDNGEKTVLGRRGNFSGIEVIDLILEHDASARFIAGKIYRFLVSEELPADLQSELGAQLKTFNYELKPFIAMLLQSADFYAHRGERIKPPVELVVSTYRKLGLQSVPGIPDFNVVTDNLGQRLLHPPTVAGWPSGRSWITPSLLFDRGNFVLDIVYPDIAFVAPDRYPTYTPNILTVQQGLRAGMDISAATAPPGVGSEMMSASNLMTDRDEAFNTRYGSYRGWQMAIERVKPIPRTTARLDLSGEVLAAGLETPEQVVQYFVGQFFSVPPDKEIQTELGKFLADALGTRDIRAAATYLEEPLRTLLHLLLSQPEYQLG